MTKSGTCSTRTASYNNIEVPKAPRLGPSEPKNVDDFPLELLQTTISGKEKSTRASTIFEPY